MPSAKGKKSVGKAAECLPQEIVVTDCELDPNPVAVSKTCQNGKSNSIFFSTPDPDRVYRVEIKNGVFNTGTIKEPFWATHPTPVFTVLKDAKNQRFKYKLRLFEGEDCTGRRKGRNAPPPTILIQD